jgi:MoxR-like ATPase
MELSDSTPLLESLRNNVESVVLGKARQVRLLLASFLAGGHVLLEDLPGTGKTTLARALAGSISGSFRRIQFTSDLLPQDITGVHVFDPESRTFSFAPGPLFANIVLADEINRGNPRAQSALLEAMSERQVTADRETFPLPDPFLVVATQNPFEHHGTYPLPESQLDRFNVRLRLSYPDAETEMRLIREQSLSVPAASAPPVLSPSAVRELKALCASVALSPPVLSYLHAVVEGTRAHPSVRLGASTRGAIGLKGTAQGLALLSGRPFVSPGDVKEAAVAALAHRVFLSGSQGHGEETAAAEAVVSEVLDSLTAPE